MPQQPKGAKQGVYKISNTMRRTSSPPLPSPPCGTKCMGWMFRQEHTTTYLLIGEKREFVTQTEFVALVTSRRIVQDQNECIHHLCAHGSFIKGKLSLYLFGFYMHIAIKNAL